MIEICSFWGIALISYIASGLLMALFFGLTFDQKGENISVGYGVICCMCPVLNTLLAIFVVLKFILFAILWVFGNIAWEFTDFWKSVFEYVFRY